MRRAFAPVAAFAAIALVASAPAAAQTPEGHGIAGFWNMGFGPMAPSRNPTPVEAELMAHFPEGTVVLTDTGLTEFPPGDYGGLAIHEELVEDAKDYDYESGALWAHSAYFKQPNFHARLAKRVRGVT